MEFFEAVHRRRSVRRYTDKVVPPEVVERALDAALVAPNSSNMQTWEFYWVRSADKKAGLVRACLGQGAARTAQELVVVVADRKLWKRNNREIIARFRTQGLPKFVVNYYARLMPMVYGWVGLAPFKWIGFHAIGLFKPLPRGPWSCRDIQEVCVKSAALACENFMLAVAAQGFDTCPMEGFDEWRLKRLLGLRCSARVVMVISVGERDPKGVWGERFRLPKEWFVKQV